MTEQSVEGKVSLVEVSKALELVGVLLGQLTIPATRSQEFAVTINVLSELKNHVDSKLAPPVQEAEAVVSPEQEAASE